MLGALNGSRWHKVDKVDVLAIFNMLVFVLVMSGCKESGSEFYIPTKDMQCIDLTKKSIQARGEDYARYTDKVMETGEAVWVAGKKFDFDFVHPAPGISVATFRNEYSRVDRHGRLYPGVLLTMKESVKWMKEKHPELIKTTPDLNAQNIVIRLKCKIGAAPNLKTKSSIEDAYSEVMGGGCRVRQLS